MNLKSFLNLNPNMLNIFPTIGSERKNSSLEEGSKSLRTE